MFHCGECGDLTKPGESGRTYVVERRDKEYPVKNEDGSTYMPDKGRRGWEIAKEVRLCPSCAAKRVETA